MRQIGIFLLALTMICFISTNAKGEPITDPSELSPNPTIIDFEAISNFANPLIIGDVTFTSVTASLSLLNVDTPNWPVAGEEVAGLALFPGGEPDSAILISFANPVSEFLLGWGDPNFSGNFLRAYDANGQLLEEIAVPTGDSGGVFATWVGFKRSTADIATVLVQPDQTSPSGDDYVIDNIHYNVPTTIDIDIKPGIDLNTINLGSKGTVPVAILTTADFDASTVDPTTVTFADASPIKRKMVDKVDMVDVDYDGDVDMLLSFNTQDLNLDIYSTEATLTGETNVGEQIEGTDSVSIVRKGKK